MASTIALRRATSSPALFSKLTSPVRLAAVAHPFSTETQVTNIGGDDFGKVDVDRRPSDRGLSRRREYPPSFFSDVIDPFSPTRSLTQVLNLMDQFMDSPFLGSTRGVPAVVPTRRGWDVKEDENALFLRMDMPGLSKEDVKVCIDQNTLIIKGEAPKEAGEEEEGGEEEGGGRRRYSSRLELPRNVYKIDEMKCEMKNGVLKVVVPKVKEGEGRDVREIPVEG